MLIFHMQPDKHRLRSSSAHAAFLLDTGWDGHCPELLVCGRASLRAIPRPRHLCRMQPREQPSLQQC